MQQDISSGVYRPQMEEAQSIQALNRTLKIRLDDLLKLAADRDFYLKETKISMQRSANIHLHFQQISVLKTESYSMNMEGILDMQIPM